MKLHRDVEFPCANFEKLITVREVPYPGNRQSLTKIVVDPDCSLALSGACDRVIGWSQIFLTFPALWAVIVPAIKYIHLTILPPSSSSR